MYYSITNICDARATPWNLAEFSGPSDSDTRLYTALLVNNSASSMHTCGSLLTLTVHVPTMHCTVQGG